MLETIRAYARRRLDDSAETEQTMRRLAAYLLEAGPASRDGRPEGDWVEWLQWRGDEQDNFRVALNWARAANDGPLCTALAVDFYRYLAESSLGDEADIWADSALELLPDTPSPLRLQLLALMATSEAQTGEVGRARTVIRAFRSEAEALGEEAAAAWATTLEALFTAYMEDDLESGLALITDAAERLLAAADPRYEGTVVFGIYILCLLGRYDEAVAMVDRFETERTQLDGAPAGEYRLASFRGTIALWRGDSDTAVDLFESCIEPARRIGPRELGAILALQGQAEFSRDNYEAARLLIDKSMVLLPENAAGYVGFLNITPLIRLETEGLGSAVPPLHRALDEAAASDGGHDRVEVLTAAAEWAIAADEPAEAAVFLAAATEARDRIPDLVPHYWVRQHHERATEHLQRTLDPDDLERLYTEGKSLSYDQAAQRARALLDEAAAADGR
jgi:tetratricopeptide (TPR) repeat protein